MTDAPSLRTMTLGELHNEILDAEQEAREHHMRYQLSPDSAEGAYHWARQTSATVYAQFCRDELARRMTTPT